MYKLYGINDDILLKHLTEAYIDQIINDYKNKGYEIFRDYKINEKFHADLMIKSSSEMIVFEFKTGQLTKHKKQQIKEIKKYIDDIPNSKFQLVLINPPIDKEIYVEDLENIIDEYFSTNELPDELDVLSTHTRIEGVSNIEFESINVLKNCIELSGSGFVEVSLQYGSDGDVKRGEGGEQDDNYPFTFSIQLNHSMEIEDFNYEIDTSDFYE
jgi:hypothetical protein